MRLSRRFKIKYGENLKQKLSISKFWNFLNLSVVNLVNRHYCSDKGFKGTVVHRTLPYLHKGLLIITHSQLENLVSLFNNFKC